MNVELIEESNRTVAVVTGEVDADNCAGFGSSLLAAVGTDLIIDCSALSFIDSSGISELLRVRQELQDNGRTLTVSEPSAAVHRVLEITGLLSVLGLDPA